MNISILLKSSGTSVGNDSHNEVVKYGIRCFIHILASHSVQVLLYLPSLVIDTNWKVQSLVFQHNETRFKFYITCFHVQSSPFDFTINMKLMNFLWSNYHILVIFNLINTPAIMFINLCLNQFLESTSTGKWGWLHEIKTAYRFLPCLTCKNTI